MTYTLKNDMTSIEVNSLGDELKSFKLQTEEYLYDGKDIHWHRSSPVLFPIVGKLKNNNYKYKNKNYSMPIHGIARHLEFKLTFKSENSLCFILKNDESTLKIYPFRFFLQIEYYLQNNSLEIKYTVTSEDNILFSLGAHPAFLLKANINDSFIEFEKKEALDLLCLNLDNGCIKKDKINNFLDSDIILLEKDIFSKDALIFEKLKSNIVNMKNKINKKSIKLQFKNFPYFGIWAPINASFICLEPWCGIADYEESSYDFVNKVGIINLIKNENFKREIKISLF